MSLATMSSLEGGSSVPGSATAASMSVPQFAPVQPPRRSHPAGASATTTRMTSGENERRSMALNISPGGERRNNVGPWDGRTVGRCQAFSQIVDNCCRDFSERCGPSEHNGERGFSGAATRSSLRSIEQYRAVLQECARPSDLGRADELATVDEDLAPNRGCKAGRPTVGRPDGRTAWREYGVDAQRPQCRSDSSVDLAVRIAQGTKVCNWRGDGIGHFMIVPHGLPAGRPANDGDPVSGDSVQGLVAANRE